MRFYHVIFLITDDSCYGKALDIGIFIISIAVNQIIYSAGIILFEDAHVNNILSNIAFFGYFGDNHFSISGKDDNIIYIATISYIFVFPKRSTYKSLFPIDIELKVTYHYLGSLNGIERSYFRFALLTFAVFLL